jgi:glycosyltransferase involved in cell wall biosynthesis
MRHSNVLITVPDLSLPGGVTELFKLLNLNEINGIDYFNINLGPRKIGFIFLPIIYINFVFNIRKFHVVHVNPSLDFKSFYRDLVFVFISKLIFRKKTIIYWHGWQSTFFEKIEKSNFLKRIFLKTYGQADINITLASKFKKDLASIGFENALLVENNACVINQGPVKISTIVQNERFKLLFIARLCNGKGWDIAIETMLILQKNGFNNIILNIAGNGEDFNEAFSLASNYNLKNVNFLGHVGAELKSFYLRDSNVLFFPTYYDEGLPLSVLEGMINGLPIISRNVGGIPDHVIHGKNGFLTESLDPEIFANFIIELYENQELFKSMSLNNKLYALENFTPERLTKNLLSLYQ